MKPSVFFGPFIGEFGWELHSWSGWVNYVSTEYFGNYHRIAATAPGRGVLYPEVDTVLFHPAWWTELPIIPRAYFTDGWSRGEQQDMTLAHKLLDEYRSRLPEGTTVFCPFSLNRFAPQNLVFGIETAAGEIVTHIIPTEKQRLRPLHAPADVADRLPESLRETTQPIVSLFPRDRPIRVDFNWSEQKYRALIVHFQRAGFLVAILGEPGGCYFADGVPEGCVDLIHADPALRSGLHVACLERSALAAGAMSGAVPFALAAGCPTLTWGLAKAHFRCYETNFFRTRTYYYPKTDPSADEVWQQVLMFVRNRSWRQWLSRTAFHLINHGPVGTRLYWRLWRLSQAVAK